MQGDLHESDDPVYKSELDPQVREAVDRAFGRPVPQELLQEAIARFEAIGQRPQPRRVHRRASWFALSGIAASVVLAALVWRADEPEPVSPQVRRAEPVQAEPIPSVEPAATLQAYRLALRDGPDEMLALLERNGAQVFQAGPEDSDPWPNRWLPLSKYEDWEIEL
jgi:hypothetical protein